jgi:hypothetical protein
METIHLADIFETAVRRACAIVPRLSHVDPSRILVLAHRLPPSRLGQTIGLRHQRRPLRVEGRGALYAMGFSAGLVAATAMPGIGESRAASDELALDTVMHELWHVAEACDGTIRPMRHGKTFDAVVRSLRRDYLRAGGEPLRVVDLDARVSVRQLGRRVGDAFPVRERVAVLARLVPPRLEYACPFGHVVVRFRKLSRPSSCAVCSRTFNPAFLLVPRHKKRDV